MRRPLRTVPTQRQNKKIPGRGKEPSRSRHSDIFQLRSVCWVAARQQQWRIPHSWGPPCRLSGGRPRERVKWAHQTRMAACSSGRRSARRFSKTPNIQTMSDQRLPTNHCQTDSSKARDVLGPEVGGLVWREGGVREVGRRRGGDQIHPHKTPTILRFLHTAATHAAR